MKKNTVRKRVRNAVYQRWYCLKGLFLLLIFPVWLIAAEVGAAQITFQPNGLTVTAAPGDEVSVPISVSLAETSLPNAYASFILAHVNGNLDRNWINSQLFISLNSWYKSRQAMFKLKIPQKAKSGAYQGIFRTMWLRSNEQIAEADLVINVDVSPLVTCSQVPLFSDIVSSEDAINARNNKQVTIDLSGSVSSPDGCEIKGARYELIDEYSELTLEPQVLPLDEDGGSFSVVVPLVASRRGNDRDGRLYTVKFFAENAAGVGNTETRIVVMHDNRK